MIEVLSIAIIRVLGHLRLCDSLIVLITAKKMKNANNASHLIR